jgi:hypothetical protein
MMYRGCGRRSLQVRIPRQSLGTREKRRPFFLECELHSTCWPVPLFADDDFGLAFFWVNVALVIYLISLNEKDNVSILLNGSRFSQISQLKASVGAVFHLPIELRQRNYR